MPTVSRRIITRAGIGLAAFAAVLGASAPDSSAASDETDAPLSQLDADFVDIAVSQEGGESVEVNFVLDVAGLDGGLIEIESDVGDSRLLATLDSDFEDLQWVSDTRVEWTCASADCMIAATLRIDFFTETDGVVRLTAAGGVASGEVPVDAELEIRADDAVPGMARVFELTHSLVDYPDTGDQAPHAALDLVEYNLGDPSDDIQLVVRPMLGEITLDSPSSLPAPSWAQNLVPIEFSGACSPDCSGSALIRVGPSDFSNLEYQVLAYSDRPGAARSLRATRTPVTAVTEIGFVTLTADAPVVAIPITLDGDVESSRVVADVGVRGRSSFVTLRPVGTTPFEPAEQWVAPGAGETQFELAISAPETQLGDVTTAWTITLFTFADATVSIEVGEPTPAQFAVGEIGDPAQYLELTPPGEESGSGPPWALLVGATAVAAGGVGTYRYRSKRS